MRSFEVGLVVAARCVCVLRMVLRSVDLLRPKVLFSFPSVTSDRASARMSAALSSTPRVSVACLVVVRVGPMLLAARCGPLSGQPLVLLAAVRSRAVTTAAWAAASMACCVLRYRSSVAVRLRSGAAADKSPARSQPTANHCLYRPPTPGCQARGWSLIALVVEACRKSL